MMLNRFIALSSLSLVAGTAGWSSAATVISDGHWDFEVAYHDGEWEPHWHNHDTETELEFGDTIMRGVFDGNATGPATGIDLPTPRPSGTQWNFTGQTAGGELYIFPNSNFENEIPYIGIASEETEPGVFVNNKIFLKFDSIVSGPAGGHYSLFGGAVSPVAYHSSLGDASTVGSNVLEINAGGHSHYNIAFTEIGTYVLSFNAYGTLAAGNTLTQSGTFEATFQVIPEPATLGLLGLGGMLLGRRRRA